MYLFSEVGAVKIRSHCSYYPFYVVFHYFMVYFMKTEIDLILFVLKLITTQL